MPGGKLRRGESPLEAAAREVLEETGVRCRGGAVVATVGEELRSNGRVYMHYLMLFCRLCAATERLRRSEEGKARWFSPHELARAARLVVPSDRRMLGLVSKAEKPYYHCVVNRSDSGRYRVSRFH